MARPTLRFVAYDRLDPNGSPLGTLTEAEEKQFNKESAGIGIGSGQFYINRNSSQAAWAHTDNFIRVFLDGVGLTDPIGGFWIEAGEDNVVSEDEQGGDRYLRAGRGTGAYLERGVLKFVEFTTNFYTVRNDNKWHWVDRKVGTIARDIIREVKANGPDPFPDLTFTWTNNDDSDSVAFEEVPGDFAIEIGKSVPEALGLLAGQGLTYELRPDFELLAWQDYVRDTPGITFAEGTNIRSSVTREVHASDAKSRVLVQGTRASGNTVFRSYFDADIEDEIGVRETFRQFDKTATDAAMSKYGHKVLTELKKAHDGQTTIGVMVGDNTSGDRALGRYVPFVDYFDRDIVTIDIPGEFDAVEKPIDAIILTDTPSGECDVAIVVNLPTTDPVGGGADEDPLPPFTRNCDAGGVDSETDLNAGKTVTATGVIAPANPNNVTDSNVLTSSTIGSGVGSGSEHGEWVIDYGTPTAFGGFGHYVESACNRALKLQGSSDNATWFDVADTGGIEVGVVTKVAFAVTTYRYWRLKYEANAGFYCGAVLHSWEMYGASLECTVPAANQPVAPLVLFVGDGVTTAGQTPNPYVPGSVAVTVNGQNVIVTETDPDTGSITLPFAPPAGLEVIVTYMAASGDETGAPYTAPTPTAIVLPGGATTGIWRPLMDGLGNVVVDSGTGEAIMAFTT